MSETKTIWVTGSKGFIGSELVNRLEKHGYRVVGTRFRIKRLRTRTP